MEEIILDVGRTVVNSARKSGDYAAVNYSKTEVPSVSHMSEDTTSVWVNSIFEQVDTLLYCVTE
jgi:hypothetical protein